MWNDGIELIDFHSHIICHIDDGASDPETSVEMLSMLSSQGVDIVVATPHFHGDEKISSFVRRRDEAIKSVEKALADSKVSAPRIVPAAEVRLYPDMHKDEELSLLCVASSNKLLVEMPYTGWSDWMFSEIYALEAKGYMPIMAHVERYIDYIGEKDIEKKLLGLNVLVQCNADFVFSRKEKKFVKKLIEQNRLTVLGSDCHNTDLRSPHMAEAVSYLAKKYGRDCVGQLMSNAKRIINEK